MNKKAFTLVELAVVLLVIGILAGLLLRNLGGFTASARDQRRIGDLRNVSAYITNYYARQGQYPTANSWSDLEAQLRDVGVLGPGVSLPKDPSSPNRTYNYYPCERSEGVVVNYILKAVLETPITQAPTLYQGRITEVPTGLTCKGDPSCSGDNDYCLLF
jgi:prepilin-type N-terminal cleavage/methylation domain-containing protein